MYTICSCLGLTCYKCRLYVLVLALHYNKFRSYVLVLVLRIINIGYVLIFALHAMNAGFVFLSWHCI